MAKAAKKPAKDKKPRKPKAPKADPKSAAPQIAGSNSIDRDQQNLARHHRDKYITLKAAVNRAGNAMRAFEKVVKGDGLKMAQIKIMVDLMTPEGEAAFRANIASDLQAAQWQGAAVGAQLQLFLEPDRTPSEDMAYEEGVQDAMDGKTATPKYAPSVPQHQRYMAGYHDETARRVKDGIKDDVKPNPTRAETLAAARAKNAEEPPADDAKLH